MNVFNGVNWNISCNIYVINQSSINTQKIGTPDFDYGFGGIGYTITGKINSDGSINTHFHITDEYVFYNSSDKEPRNQIARVSQLNNQTVKSYFYNVDIYETFK